MPIRTFRITGTVIGRDTKKPVAGLRLEAWNKDAAEHILYGSTLSDSAGRFTIPADVNIPGGIAGSIPAFLKAFKDERAITLTGDTVIPNLIVQDRAIRVIADAGVLQPEKKDRVTFEQVESVVDFVRLSDFRGLYEEGRSRALAGIALGKDAIFSAVSNFKLEPIRPPATRSGDVLSQDPQSATKRLADREIVVTQVKQYSSKEAGLNSITSLSTVLKKGDQVELYEENGVVKAYKVVNRIKTVEPSGDFARVDSQLGLLKSDLEKRDTQIKELRTQVEDANRRAAEREAEATRLAEEVRKVRTEKDEQVTKLTRDLTTLNDDSKREAQEHETEATRLAEEVRKLKTEKDDQVGKLTRDLATLKTDHDKVVNDRIKAIEEKLRRIP